MTHYLITGASGLLGLNLAIDLGKNEQVIGVVNRHNLKSSLFGVLNRDLTQTGAVEQLIEEVQPDVVINCAALAVIDACEQHPVMAYQLNTHLPADLARETARRGIKFIHISTDAVFDGQKGNYTEDDLPNPLSIYGRSKLAGEVEVAANNPDALIARVNFFGWSLSGHRSLAEVFYQRLSTSQPVNGFIDVHFCPLQVNDLCDLLIGMIAKDLTGLYHAVSPDSLSKFEFGTAIAHQFGFDSNLIKPVSWMAEGLKAVRASNLTINVARVTAALGNPPPGLQHGLERFHQQMLEGYPLKLRELCL